jgi:hypothetical protein
MPKQIMIQTTIYNTIVLNNPKEDNQPKIQTTIFMGKNNDEGFVSETSLQDMLNELTDFYQEEKEQALNGLHQMKKLIEEKIQLLEDKK